MIQRDMNDEERDTSRTMAHIGKRTAAERAAINEMFKIPSVISKCRCGSKKIIKEDDKSGEELAITVIFSQKAHMSAFHVLKLSGNAADFKVLGSLIDQMMIIEKDKKLPDLKFVALAQGYCESFLRLHPPCEFHTVKVYRQLLEESNRFNTLFREMMLQVELAAKNVMPERHPRREVRRVYADDESDCAELVKRFQTIEESFSKKYGELLPSERVAYLFSTLSVFVKILEIDFEVWKNKLISGLTTSKSYRPLIIHLLWKDVLRFDEDAILNSRCTQIFKFYTICLHNKVLPAHLKVVARLINLISEVVDLIARHQEAKPDEGFTLKADFRNFHYQARLENGFHGFALKEIENGTRKVQKPILYHLDDGTVIGNLCKTFASSLASSLGRCSCEDVKECLVLEKAFIFLKPPWLLYLTSSCLLKQDPSIHLLKTTAREALFEDEDMSSQKHRLRSILFSSAVDTLQMLGYRTSRPRKDVKRFSKRVKLDPADVKSSNDVGDIIDLISQVKRLKP